MTDTGKLINPRHFGSDRANVWIRIRINPEIQTRIQINFWLRLDVLPEVCVVSAQSSSSIQLVFCLKPFDKDDWQTTDSACVLKV